jgi:hypothetical protein
MSEKRYLDPGQRAALRFPDFKAKFFNSALEAVDHWKMLDAQQRAHAVLVCEEGAVYQPSEIASLQICAASAP